MKGRERVVLITGDCLRHSYLANRLAESVEVVGVVCEKKRLLPSGLAEENIIIREHFKKRDEAEQKLLGEYGKLTSFSDRVLYVQHGESNSNYVFDWIKTKNPSTVVLYGCSIIKNPLLSFYSGRVVNMHLGLSPYYRGAGTNFWPLVFNEPECVGATIHLATLQVDAGDILIQVRPEIELTDDCYSMGCKTIIKAAGVLPEAALNYLKGKIKAEAQKNGGRLFRNKDFNAQAVEKMKANFSNGMIAQFLADKDSRLQKYPIIEQSEVLSG